MDSRARGSNRRREATGSRAGIQRNDKSSVAWSGEGRGRIQCRHNCPRKLHPGCLLGHTPSLCPVSSAPGRKKMSLQLKRNLGQLLRSAAEARGDFETGRGGTRLTPPPSRRPGARPQFMQPALVERRRDHRPLISRRKDPPSPGGAATSYLQQPRDPKTAHHVTGAALPFPESLDLTNPGPRVAR